MVKSYHIQYPKCNNKNFFQRYGKDKFGNQKYRCKECSHQFAPDTPKQRRNTKYPRCPYCGKAMFLHHNYQYYSNFRCCDKKCNHSMFIPKPKRVQSFQDDVTNNLIECFNKQFKAWYKIKQGFSFFKSVNNLISTFIFFFNLIRPHSVLNGLTLAECAGLNLSLKRKREFLISFLKIF